MMEQEYGHVVVIQRDGKDGAVFPLKKPECLFGRSDDCDVRIQLPEVSREHCKLMRTDDGQIFLMNLSIVNPTCLNKVPIQTMRPIGHKDVFTVADRSFRLEVPHGSPARVLQLVQRLVALNKENVETSGTPAGRASSVDTSRTGPRSAANENHSNSISRTPNKDGEKTTPAAAVASEKKQKVVTARRSMSAPALPNDAILSPARAMPTPSRSTKQIGVDLTPKGKSASPAQVASGSTGRGRQSVGSKRMLSTPKPPTVASGPAGDTLTTQPAASTVTRIAKQTNADVATPPANQIMPGASGSLSTSKRRHSKSTATEQTSETKTAMLGQVQLAAVTKPIASGSPGRVPVISAATGVQSASPGRVPVAGRINSPGRVPRTTASKTGTPARTPSSRPATAASPGRVSASLAVKRQKSASPSRLPSATETKPATASRAQHTPMTVPTNSATPQSVASGSVGKRRQSKSASPARTPSAGKVSSTSEGKTTPARVVKTPLTKLTSIASPRRAAAGSLTKHHPVTPQWTGSPGHIVTTSEMKTAGAAVAKRTTPGSRGRMVIGSVTEQRQSPSPSSSPTFGRIQSPARTASPARVAWSAGVVAGTPSRSVTKPTSHSRVAAISASKRSQSASPGRVAVMAIDQPSSVATASVPASDVGGSRKRQNSKPGSPEHVWSPSSTATKAATPRRTPAAKRASASPARVAMGSLTKRQQSQSASPRRVASPGRLQSPGRVPSTTATKAATPKHTPASRMASPVSQVLNAAGTNVATPSRTGIKPNSASPARMAAGSAAKHHQTAGPSQTSHTPVHEQSTSVIVTTPSAQPSVSAERRSSTTKRRTSKSASPGPVASYAETKVASAGRAPSMPVAKASISMSPTSVVITKLRMSTSPAQGSSADQSTSSDHVPSTVAARPSTPVTQGHVVSGSSTKRSVSASPGRTSSPRNTLATKSVTPVSHGQVASASASERRDSSTAGIASIRPASQPSTDVGVSSTGKKRRSASSQRRASSGTVADRGKSVSPGGGPSTPAAVETGQSPRISKSESKTRTSSSGPLLLSASPKRGTKRAGSPLNEPPRKHLGVSFGPTMSPELFDHRLPPITPVKRGATPRRGSVPTDALKPAMKGRASTVGISVPEETQHLDDAVRSKSERRRSKSAEGTTARMESSIKKVASVASTPKSVKKGTPSVTGTPILVLEKTGLTEAMSDFVKGSKSPKRRSLPGTTGAFVRLSLTKVPVRAEESKASGDHVKKSGDASPVRSVGHPVAGQPTTPDVGKRTPQKPLRYRSPTLEVGSIKVKGNKKIDLLSTRRARSLENVKHAVPLPVAPKILDSPKPAAAGKLKRSSMQAVASPVSKKGAARSSSVEITPPSRTPLTTNVCTVTPSKELEESTPQSTKTGKAATSEVTPASSSAKKSPAMRSSTASEQKWAKGLKSPGATSPSPAKRRRSITASSKVSPSRAGRPADSTQVPESAKEHQPVSARKNAEPGTSVQLTPARMVAMRAVFGIASTPKLKVPGKSPSVSSVKTSVAERSRPKTAAHVSSDRKSAPRRSSSKLAALKESGQKSAAKKTLWSEVVKRTNVVQKTGPNIVKPAVVKTGPKIFKPVGGKAKKPIKTTVSGKRRSLSSKKSRRLSVIGGVASTGHAASPVTIVIGKKKSRGSLSHPVVDRDVSTASDAFSALPSTPESPGEMYVSPLASAATPRLSGVSRLMKTPKSAKSPRLSGVKLLVKTPKVRKSTGSSGMKNRSATPKRRALSVGQMSASPELIGVKQMMKTPRATKTASLSPKLDGIRKLVKAPKLGKLPELHGARKAMKTPKAQMSPVLDGVRKLLKTPKEVAGSPTLDGVRRLVKTPKAQRSPSFAGMRKLLKTPKAQKSPQLAGVKSLLKTPKQQASPALLGVRQLMRTPKSVSQSPDLTGVHEMMTSPQTVSASPDLLLSKSVTMKKRGRNVSPAVVDVEPSPKPARARGKKVLEVQPSLKVFRSQAKKAVKKATENQKTEEVDIPSARKRHAAQRLTADDDPQVGTKRQKLAVSGSKSKSGKTPEKSVGIQAAGGSQQSSVGRSRRKGSRHPNAAIAPTESVGEVDATVAQAKPTKTPPRTRRGASKSSVSAALVHAEPKTSVGGSVKGSRTSKKTVDVYSSPLIVTTDTATGRRVVKEIVATETKKSGKSVMSADSVQSPKRVRGRLRKQAPAIVVAGVPQQHSVGRQTIALPPPAAEEEVQIVAHKSRGARKPRDADVHGDDKSVETVVVTPKPKGRSRSAKKVEVAVLLSSKTTVEPEIKTARGKGPSVRSPVVKPVTGRRTKAGSHVETVMSMPMGKSPVSTRRGKQTAAKELPPAHVSTEEKNLPSKAATGRKGKRRPIAVVEEAAEVESSNAVMPRKRRKATADDNQTSVVAEQPVAKQVKQRTTGRVVSMSTEPVVQPDKSKNKTGAKKVTIVTPVPEAVGKKNNQKSKEVESSSVSAQSERGEKCEKVVATVSPAATRTKRQMPVKAVGGKQSTKKSTVNSASSTPRGGKSVKSKTAIASPAATRSRRPKH